MSDSIDSNKKLFTKQEIEYILLEAYEAGWHGSLELKQHIVAQIIDKLFKDKPRVDNNSDFQFHTLLPPVNSYIFDADQSSIRVSMSSVVSSEMFSTASFSTELQMPNQNQFTTIEES